MKILLVEDDAQLSQDLKHQLTAEGFDVDVAYDGQIAEKLFSRSQYDLFLFDVNIPFKNGYALVKSLRQQDISTPVILITAFGEIEDKLQGFEYGADDYITKPFYFKELLARIKVFLKRSQFLSQAANQILIADLIINRKTKQVVRAEQNIKLTAKEFDLLIFLAEAQGDIVSKKEILQKVWGTTYEANTNTVEVFINLLRNKIDKQFELKLIKTRVGFGYYLAETE